jgi:hypothetical protein
MKKHDENSPVEMLEGAKSIGAGAATITSLLVYYRARGPPFLFPE